MSNVEIAIMKIAQPYLLRVMMGPLRFQSGFREEGDLAKGNAPDDMEECASKAAKGCPASVITVSK